MAKTFAVASLLVFALREKGVGVWAILCEPRLASCSISRVVSAFGWLNFGREPRKHSSQYVRNRNQLKTQIFTFAVRGILGARGRQTYETHPPTDKKTL